MDMIGYLGKKVDMVCKDGKKYSGYICDILDEEDSGVGEECVDIDTLEQLCSIAVPTRLIEHVTVDSRYKEFDFRH